MQVSSSAGLVIPSFAFITLFVDATKSIPNGVASWTSTLPLPDGPDALVGPDRWPSVLRAVAPGEAKKPSKRWGTTWWTFSAVTPKSLAPCVSVHLLISIRSLHATHSSDVCWGGILGVTAGVWLHACLAQT